MFTGLVETTGKIVSIQSIPDSRRLLISTEISRELKRGESISVDGVCLTVEEANSKSFKVYLSRETLQVSKFGKSLKVGQIVNLERALRAGDRLGGHIVQGHVDTVAKLREIRRLRDSVVWRIGEIPPKFMKYVVKKGSIAVDGVSLTVNELEPDGFTVQLIPETLKVTNFDLKRVGDPLNIEFDIIGKYVERLLQSHTKY